MNQEEIDILIKAGELGFKAHKYAQKIIKPGVDLNKVGLKIDQFVIDNNAFPAWPVNLSINNEAAHNSYDLETERILKEDDVLKVDIGVSIDGYISDSAQTIVFNKKNEPLKQASVDALAAAKKYLSENYKTATISEVSDVIYKKIKESGFNPVSNLTGHYITRYTPHASPSIPNVPNTIPYKFSDFEEHFAIEPFVSTGDGSITEGAQILIFEHEEDRPVRNKAAKEILDEIKQFNGMPFSEYWVGKSMNPFTRKYALRELLRLEIISGFPILIGKKDTLISQTETSFLITKDGLLDLVKIDEL